MSSAGEMPYVNDEDEIIRVVGENEHELNMIFIFTLVDIDNIPGGSRLSLHSWDANDLRRIVSKWQNVMRERGGWNSVFIENHVRLLNLHPFQVTDSSQDQPRSVSRYVDDSAQYRALGAKLLAMMQTTLSGTLYVYQGEELAMGNVPLSWDPVSVELPWPS